MTGKTITSIDPSIDRVTLLVERTLGNGDNLRELLVGENKATILQQVASEVATFAQNEA